MNPAAVPSSGGTALADKAGSAHYCTATHHVLQQQPQQPTNSHVCGLAFGGDVDCHAPKSSRRGRGKNEKERLCHWLRCLPH